MHRGGAVMTWDISNGTRWVVISLRGEVTTSEFYDDQSKAEFAYARSVREGADVLFARVMKVSKNK